MYSEKFYESDNYFKLFQILIYRDLGNFDCHHYEWGIEQQRLNRNSWGDRQVEDQALSPTSLGRGPWLFQKHTLWSKTCNKLDIPGSWALMSKGLISGHSLLTGQVHLSPSLNQPLLPFVCILLCAPFPLPTLTYRQLCSDLNVFSARNLIFQG